MKDGPDPASPAQPIRKRRKRRKSRLLVWLEYALFRGLAGAVHGMSETRLERWSARVGKLAARVLASRNRVAMRNLRAAFPQRSERELRGIAQDCWRHYARSILDYFRASREDAEAITARIRFEGPKQELFASVERDPALILFAHYGNWEMGTYIAPLFDRRVTAVARRLDNPLIDRDLLKNRERGGLTILDRRKAARELMRALERGEIVAMVVDQAVKPREGILAPFVGHPAWTTTAPARLALRYGVQIWCLHVVAEGGFIDVTIDPPVIVANDGDSEAAIAAATARINEQFSRRIMARPELWLWMHDRWKGAPEPDESGVGPDESGVGSQESGVR